MKIKKRFQYTSPKGIFPQDVKSLNPFELFKTCFHLADEKTIEANKMVLSTVNSAGRPSSRVVLLKEFNEEGFVFYTHYDSKKGFEIEEKPFVALNFYWEEIKIQVRIEGEAKKVSSKKSTDYFKSRPQDSQLSTILSKQSKPLESHEDFLRHFNENKKLNLELTKPASWGGYRVVPHYFEFWKGNENRLHERVVFTKKENWLIQRLYP